MVEHVSAVSEDTVRVHCGQETSATLKLRFGAAAEASGGRVEVTYDSREALASVLSGLRDAGIPFLDGPHGWPPAAVFVDLRAAGLVQGAYRAVSWRGADEPIVRPSDDPSDP